MLSFFQSDNLLAVESKSALTEEVIQKLSWLFGGAAWLDKSHIEGSFIGPRKEMITPWSTNAVEITQNMAIEGIQRIEEFLPVSEEDIPFDPMLQNRYDGLGQDLFTIDRKPENIREITDIATYNSEEGLALSPEEVQYLEALSKKLGRPLTDSEVFGFSQVNSEHCRHKIFNGTFVIDGEEKPETLFQLIKKTTKTNPNRIVSAYKDNCSFAAGPVAEIFAPRTQDKADFFHVYDSETVLSLKAETHNFPTTVEPFYGASTGTGGEIRDRIAGGKTAFPIAGTAVYMTSYPRPNGGRSWEKALDERPWLYQTPQQILIKASNGASDFGNKFGQPLINGSLFTFEHAEGDKKWGYDKVIMLAGGIGYGKKSDSEKDLPKKGDVIVLLGGDNYRIGMGGGAVSSVATGEYDNAIELNAVQRANPEMQKRVYNALRALAEGMDNPVVSIHDHGAGGHLNCLSELVETSGGTIDIRKLPIGDPTLSAKEIIGNESQERMGLVLKKEDVDRLKRIAERERAPMYVIGEVTGDMHFSFTDSESGEKPMDMELADLFGNPPRTLMEDRKINTPFLEPEYKTEDIEHYLEEVLQLEAVACKDWLTNKVDRSVTGRLAKQQCAGPLQLPLNNLGVITLDYQGKGGLATALGHAPGPALIDPAAGSVLAIAESLTNLIWAPLAHGLKGVSLSANWMWPCKNEGEDARLYEAVKAASDFAIALGINIPTGKDSLSMSQKYKDETVYAPGTVIITSSAEVSDVRKIVEPVLKDEPESHLLYVDMSLDGGKLGGSSLAQVLNKVGNEAPTVKDAASFAKTFETIQELIQKEMVLAGHDVSSGGLITALLEMTFAQLNMGLDIDLTQVQDDPVSAFFSEQPGLVLQVRNDGKAEEYLQKMGVQVYNIGEPIYGRNMTLQHGRLSWVLDILECRDQWYKTSYLLDIEQCGADHAMERYDNYKKYPLEFNFRQFEGSYAALGIRPDRRKDSGIKAAIIREKGVNGDREMAWALYLAGFDVKDVHMTDLISGRETLEDIQMIVFVGGFSNSDVLGSAKGWAGAFKFNEKAKKSLENFYAREDTLSLGICNGCQLMVELDLLTPDHKEKPRMKVNASGKFESGFITVDIEKNNSVMLRNMEDMRLGIWVAHAEGQFSLPYAEEKYNVPVRYSQETYPGNPNGSPNAMAALCSEDGRHLAMMPHLERAFAPWQCGYYPEERRKDDITPWMQAFVNAREWLEKK